MDVATSSSSLVSPARQYERFREAVSATHLAWDMPTRRNEPFSWRMRSRSLGPASLAACICDPCHGRRERQEVARTTHASFGVLYILSGRERIEQPGAKVELREGTFTIWDATQPLRFEVPGELRKLTLLVPEPLFTAAIPDARAHLGITFESTRGCGALFSSHLRALNQLEGSLARSGQEVALRTALDLLAGTLAARSIDDGRSDPAPALLAEIMHHARARIADPELDADSIARALGLSRRQLDRVFASTGQTITRWIWRERVLRCHRDLMLAPQAKLIDIAFRWGFNDAAHFSRVFRREFKMSPSEARKQARPRFDD